MSKTVAITEGDRAYRFGKCSYLRTNKQGGGYAIWVPEDDRETTTKSITKNGTYKISDEKKTGGGKYYGYSEVSVNVPNSGKAVGKKPDGNTHVVQPDANGDLTDKIIPDSIRIITQPSTLTYEDGDTISKDGMVVKAYQGDGSLWEATGYSGGIIPNSELNLNPSVAHYEGGNDEWSDGDGVNAVRLAYTEHNQSWRSYGTTHDEHFYVVKKQLGTRDGSPITIGAGGEGVVLVTKYQGTPYVKLVSGVGGFDQYSIHALPYGNYVSADDNTVYHLVGGTAYRPNINAFTPVPQVPDITEIPESTKDPSQAGTMSPTGGNSVTVEWERPDDLKILADTFNIDVVPLR